MAVTSFQQVTAMLVELNPQIFKKEVFCISSKGFNQRDAYRVMLRKYPDVMNIEQMCDALRISTKTGYKLLHEGKIPARLWSWTAQQPCWAPRCPAWGTACA